jgi:Cupin domain
MECRVRSLRRARHDAVVHHRLRNRTRRTSRLAHGRHRGNAILIAGSGELLLEDGSKHAVGPGSVFVLPTPLRHDLVNVGTETLRAVAFFAAAMFTQTFDNMMLPPKTHVLGTPNRNG